MLKILLVRKEDGQPVDISEDGAIHARLGDIPFTGEGAENHFRPFRQHLTSNGLPADGGTEDMRVAGSLAGPIDFWVPAHQTKDRWISSLSFALAGDAADLSTFISFNQGALTNGVKLLYEDEEGEVIIHDGFKDNLDPHRLAGVLGFGDGATALQLPGLGPPPAKANGYLPTVRFPDIFPMPWGIRLRRGTLQRLVIRIQDDLTHADNEQFDVVAYGIDVPPPVR